MNFSNNKTSFSRFRVVLLSASFLFPFICVLFLNLFFLPGGYFIARTDAPEFLLSLGLNHLTGYPLKVWHLPGYFWGEISALILLLTGLPDKNLNSFQFLGIIFQILVLLIAAVWTGRLADRLKLRIWEIMILAIVAASLPALLAYSRIWGYNFSLIVLSLPLGLSLCEVAAEETNYLEKAFWPLLVIGFNLANFILALPLLVASLTLIFFKFVCDSSSLEERLSDSKNFYWLKTAALGFFALIIVFSLIEPLAWKSYDRWKLIIYGLFFVGSFSIYVLLRHPLLNGFAVRVALPVLMGWGVGANRFVLYWIHSLFKAIETKGSAKSGYPASEWIKEIDFSFFFTSRPWYLLLLIALLWSFVSIVSSLLRRGRKSNGNLPITIFTFIGILTLFGMTAEVGLRRESFVVPDCGYFGIMPDRYYVIAPCFVVPVFIFLVKEKWKKSIFVAFVLVISARTIQQYLRSHSWYVAHTLDITKKVDQIIDSHLSECPNNIVLIARVALTERARILYGYNAYRTFGSLRRLFVGSLANGRIVDISSLDDISSNELIKCLPLKRIDDHAIILIQTNEMVPGFKVLWSDPLTKIKILRLTSEQSTN